MEKSANAMIGLTTPGGILRRVEVGSMSNAWWSLSKGNAFGSVGTGWCCWVGFQPHACWSPSLTCSDLQPVSLAISSKIPKTSSWASLVARHSAATARKRIDRLATPLISIVRINNGVHITITSYLSFTFATIPHMSCAWLCCTLCISGLNSFSKGCVFVRRIRVVW